MRGRRLSCRSSRGRRSILHRSSARCSDEGHWKHVGGIAVAFAWPHRRTAGVRNAVAWLACHTQEEIAEKENVSQPTVAALISEFSDLEKLIKADKAAAEHATDFDVPSLDDPVRIGVSPCPSNGDRPTLPPSLSALCGSATRCTESKLACGKGQRVNQYTGSKTVGPWPVHCF